jgi:septin family protein
MLTQENLEKIENLDSGQSLMSKFLQDNLRENANISEEIEKNMAFAMIHYNEESNRPYLFRRISSTSTVKSIYYNSTPSSDSSGLSLKSELQLMIEDKPAEKVYYNILVAGDSGLGKTSFISTYMYLKFNYFQSFQDCSDVIPTTTEIVHYKARRTEGKIDFLIDFIDTPGYGSYRDVAIWTKLVSKYLLTQIVEYKKDPQKVDQRVHACLYFIDAVLKQDDVKALKEINKFTTVIPVIGKADTCTVEEIKKFKKIVMGQLLEAGIEIFQPKDEDVLGCIGGYPPFSVISAVSRIKVGQKPSLGRIYHWGFCDINNPAHSDFPILSKMLIGKFCNQVKLITKKKCKQIVQLWKIHEEKHKKKARDMKNEESLKKYERAGKFATAVLLGFVKMIIN